MRRFRLGWGLLLPALLGCSGENIVGGTAQTKAEQLESALPEWCPSVCERLRACAESTGCDCNGDVCECSGVDDGCEEQCPRAFAPYVDAGEFCAAVGQRIQKCIDAMKCEDLDGRDPCRPSAAELRACPDPNDPEDSDAPPTGAGPSSGSGGPTDSSAGTNPVSCRNSTASGGGGLASGGARVTCEEARTECSDQRVYSWICSQDSQGQRACACLVDAQTTGSFVPTLDCPSASQVNAGCGWALLQ